MYHGEMYHRGGDTGLILMGTRVGKRVRACSRRQGGGQGVPGLRGERLLICDEVPVLLYCPLAFKRFHLLFDNCMGICCGGWLAVNEDHGLAVTGRVCWNSGCIANKIATSLTSILPAWFRIYTNRCDSVINKQVNVLMMFSYWCLLQPTLAQAASPNKILKSTEARSQLT